MNNLIALFSDPDFLKAVTCEKVQYEANSLILQENDEGQDLFLITQGEAEVSYNLQGDVQGLPARIARLKVNDIFGELSVFDRGERTAEVKAVTDCEAFKVSGPKLVAYLDANPTKGYLVMKELFMHSINYMRQNNLRTKMTLEMYYHEHTDD
ncbi:MAG: cyclic nucleotide-binding domain-containing protein [Methylococcaceae bacterium]|nr:cyclic nucleotide-binding domain-containing protein [Methylococcaceae bacterium]